MDLRRRYLRAGNRIGVWLYRRTGGRVASGSGQKVLMLTTPGRVTGIARSTCVQYLDTDDGLLVWGTGSGSRRDPDWFRNLRAAGQTDVQVRADRFTARVHELRGDERDKVWDHVILVQVPAVERLARKAGRTIPVAVLTRT